MFDGQIEMSFGNGNRRINRRRRRLSRAQWWFQRMRQVVDRAIDWQPVPPPRPEQIWLAGTCRQAAESMQPQGRAGLSEKAAERQMCE
jgi:hypothetical protein